MFKFYSRRTAGSVTDLLLLIGEACFGFSLQIIRHATKNEFGYELTTRYGTEVTALGPMFIMTVGLTIIMGYLADNFVGKFYISIIGVLMVFCACLCTSFNFILPIPSMFRKDFYLTCATTFLMIYISTSGVKNAMLLEQFEVSHRTENLRNYIFGFIIVRLFTYCLTPVLSQLLIPQEMYLNICILSVLTCLAYLLLLILILPKLYIEAVYFRIWEKCGDCIVTAMLKRKLQSRKTDIVVKPIRRNISPERSNHNFSLFSAPPNEKKAVVKFNKIVELQFQGGAAAETIPEPKLVKSQWGFRLVKSISPGQDSISNVSDDEKVPDAQYVVVRKHWLDYAKPKKSEYIISQSRKLISVIHMLIPPFFFTILSYMILWHLSYQDLYSIKPKIEKTSPSHYCILFDIICFPVFEYFIYSTLSRLGFREFHFVFTGYLFLIVAGVCTLIIQIELETTLQYLPVSYSSQIRIFNNINSHSMVHTSWSTSENIPPFSYILLKGIPEKKNKKHRVKIINLDVPLDNAFDIDIVHKRTVSYIISKTKYFTKNSNMDPTIFTNEENVDKTKSLLFLVTVFPPGIVSLRFNSGTVEHDNIFSKDNGMGFVMEPGIYQVTAIMGIIHLNIGNYHIKPGILYAFDFGYDDGTFRGDLHPLEGPLTLFVDYFLIPHFFLSLSNVFSSISYYRKVFINSPEKLRSSIFSFIVAFNLIATDVFTSWLKRDYIQTSSAMFLEIFLFAAFGALYTCVYAKVTYG